MSEPGSLFRTLSGRPAARNFHSFVIGEVGLGEIGAVEKGRCKRRTQLVGGVADETALLRHRGLDRRQQRVDRCHHEIHQVVNLQIR